MLKDHRNKVSMEKQSCSCTAGPHMDMTSLTVYEKVKLIMIGSVSVRNKRDSLYLIHIP